MKKERLLTELETLVERSGYTIRKEKGTFNGDACVVEGEKLVVINAKKPKQQQVGLLARILKDIEIQDTYIKPAVRNHLEKLWARFDRFKDSEIKEMNIDLE